jgi:hypothetical protein
LKKETFGERVLRRARDDAKHALLRVLGRDLKCSACGRTLFRGLPIVFRGRVRIIGAEEHNVRIAWSSKNDLELRHLELDHCPSPDRPWVR